METLARRQHDRRPWYVDPAWLTVFGALLLHIALAGYIYGELTARVKNLELEQRLMIELLVKHVITRE